MFNFKKIFLIAGFGCALLQSGCASRAVQTESIRASAPAGIPAQKEIAGVPFIEQSENHCGPATLAMTLGFYNQSIGMEQVAPLMYNTQNKGSLQSDMLSAARRLGMNAVAIEGMPALLQEVAAGNPVIVFENLALKWLPQWHYAVVYGYDLSVPEVVMHSGPEKAKRWKMETFERSWMLGDYWGMVVLPPGQLSATADELAHASSASVLEQLGRRDDAQKSYEVILKKWPESLSAHIGMGNIYYAKGDYRKSAEVLRRAVQLHPTSESARHNLKVAESKLQPKKQQN